MSISAITTAVTREIRMVTGTKRFGNAFARLLCACNEIESAWNNSQIDIFTSGLIVWKKTIFVEYQTVNRTGRKFPYTCLRLTRALYRWFSIFPDIHLDKIRPRCPPGDHPRGSSDSKRSENSKNTDGNVGFNLSFYYFTVYVYVRFD